MRPHYLRQRDVFAEPWYDNFLKGEEVEPVAIYSFKSTISPPALPPQVLDIGDFAYFIYDYNTLVTAFYDYAMPKTEKGERLTPSADAYSLLTGPPNTAEAVLVTEYGT